MSVHIYTTASQPLTRWRIGTEILDKPSKYFRRNPRSLDWCETCYRIRWAKNLRIQVYYDCTRIHCADRCKPATNRERRERVRIIERAFQSGGGVE